MQNEKQAIIKTLKYLQKNEPVCYPCEQCLYGYTNNIKLKEKCYQQKEKIKK